MVLDRGLSQEEVDQAIQDAGVEAIVQIAADKDAIAFSKEYVRQEKPYDMYYTIGQHPGEVHEV